MSNEASVSEIGSKTNPSKSFRTPDRTMLDKLKILSWNIHDSSNGKEGRKTDDIEFMKIVTSCPIFCLQETKSEIFVSDYTCFNSCRKGTRSGGLCVGVHKSLSKQVKSLKTRSPDIQAVSIEFEANEDNKKLIVVNVYDSPVHSSYKSKQRKLGETESTLDILQEFTLNELDQYKQIYLAGDFNARTASLNFEFEDDDADNKLGANCKSHPYEMNRCSKDQVVNTRGEQFLDFLASSNLSILNGAALGDIFGEYTSVNYNGCSVVDYAATSPELRDAVKSFQVLNLTKYSDHKPCVATLAIPHHYSAADQILRLLQDAPIKYKWPKEEATDFKFMLTMNSPEFKDKIYPLIHKRCINAEEVTELNAGIISIYRNVADVVVPRKLPRLNKPTNGHKKRPNKMKSKSPWFDIACIRAKRNLNSLAKKYGEFPQSATLRDVYYEARRSYRKLIKKKRDEFIEKLCKDIEEGKNVNWKTFKSLKSSQSQTTNLDAFDMVNFCNFFTNLYGKATLQKEKISELQAKMEKATMRAELTQTLDKPISIEELTYCIKMSKQGKAVSEDLISNEFLKASTNDMLQAVLNLFNQCLHLGVYPWTTSLVTPLHKKGCIYDPNNYRAIAVASNMGKLFASILLQRLIVFRSLTDPDTDNQLGFCKDAQTSDHIFTLTTCVEKYVKKAKNRLYSCFVDYAKAFDSVCREALLFKLWKMGIQGKFFQCLEFMYSNSSAKIKLLTKLSEKIDIICGTEQGHPMSPELFKCFVHQLSLDINALSDVEVPVLNSERVTHLLWADDLVLLALDGVSLQKMLDVLMTYCVEWGLTVNISKTAVLVFNKSGRLLKESHTFTLGGEAIPAARDYCYLGVTFTLCGSLKTAQKKLRQKGLRSYFSLRRMINFRLIRKTILFKLFDALIRPVVSYACQVWLPSTSLFKLFNNSTQGIDNAKKIALDPLENLHLALLKWTLGVHKSTSNSAVWGDCGRYPLGIELSKMVFSYHERLEGMDRDNSSCLVRHAFCEQKHLGLGWYSSMETVRHTLEDKGLNKFARPSKIRAAMKTWFQEVWNLDRSQNRKLEFYNRIKHDFCEEKYLNLNLKPSISKAISQLRSSSHKLNVETGRYGLKRLSRINRVCKFCSAEDTESLELILELPFADPIIEDEQHVLLQCPQYEDLRSNLSSRSQEYLLTDIENIFNDLWSIRDVGRFIEKIFEKRFPKTAAAQ